MDIYRLRLDKVDYYSSSISDVDGIDPPPEVGEEGRLCQGHFDVVVD